MLRGQWNRLLSGGNIQPTTTPPTGLYAHPSCRAVTWPRAVRNA